MNRGWMVCTIAAAGAVAFACGTTTSRWGKPIVPVGSTPDTYAMTLHYSLGSSPDGVRREAEREAHTFMSVNGYASFEIKSSTCVTGSCEFTVHFTRRPGDPVPSSAEWEKRATPRAYISEATPVLEKAAAGSKVLYSLDALDHIEIVQSDEQWTRIRTENGVLGWVPTTKVKIQKPR